MPFSACWPQIFVFDPGKNFDWHPIYKRWENSNFIFQPFKLRPQINRSRFKNHSTSNFIYVTVFKFLARDVGLYSYKMKMVFILDWWNTSCMLHLGDFNAKIEFRDVLRLQQLRFNSFVMETISILWAEFYILVIQLVLVMTGLQSVVQIACPLWRCVWAIS